MTRGVGRQARLIDWGGTTHIPQFSRTEMSLGQGGTFNDKGPCYRVSVLIIIHFSG